MEDVAQRPGRASVARLIAKAMGLVGLCLGTVAVLVLIYALAPVPNGDEAAGEVIVVGAIGMVAYLTLTIGAVVRLSSAQHPVLEGGILVTIMATVIVLGYSWSYLGLSINDPASFTEPLTKTAAAYFTVTVLATVGFGDITPVTDTTRMVVTSQMILGITLVTVGIRLIVQSTRAAATRKHRLPEPAGAD